MPQRTELIQQAAVEKLLEKYNMTLQDGGGSEQLRATLSQLVQKKLHCYAAQCTEQRQQRGGRIVLPGEYFGTDSGRYVAGVSDHTLMDITQVGRPELPMSGGAAASHKLFSMRNLSALNKDAQGNRLFTQRQLRDVAHYLNQDIEKFFEHASMLVKNQQRRLGTTHMSQALKEV
jgi:hypothetical protein